MARVAVEAVGFLKQLFARSGALPAGDALDALVLSVPEGTTLEALVRRLADSHPAFAAIAYDDGRWTGAVQVVVGDLLLDLAGGWERVVAENDTVVLLPAFEGG